MQIFPKLVLILLSCTTAKKQEIAKPYPAGLNSNIPFRIVGGYQCGVEEHPYVVRIRFTVNFKHHCGGTIISHFWILTAAHCCSNPYIRGSFTVVAGLNRLSRYMTRKKINGIQTSLVARNYQHKLYQYLIPDFDIGLLELEYPLHESETVRFVTIDFKSFIKEEELMSICHDASVMGWGSQYAQDKNKNPLITPVPDHDPYLQCVNIPVISQRKCQNMVKRRISETLICAFYHGKDGCRGDSGGPMICQGLQYGLISSGIGCAYKEYPGIYVKVFLFEDFIYSVMSRSDGYVWLCRYKLIVLFIFLIFLLRCN